MKCGTALLFASEDETRGRAFAQIAIEERPKNLANGNRFNEEWAARHNQDVWGTGPSGIYEAMPPPYRA
jgi:hypothetical protein